MIQVTLVLSSIHIKDCSCIFTPQFDYRQHTLIFIFLSNLIMSRLKPAPELKQIRFITSLLMIYITILSVVLLSQGTCIYMNMAVSLLFTFYPVIFFRSINFISLVTHKSNKKGTTFALIKIFFLLGWKCNIFDNILTFS